jgi:muconate cycloisomerase
MALWDLRGKEKNVPVYELLGGKVRESLPMKMVVGGFSVEKATALARRFLDWGATCLKVKVGIDDDIARVSSIRELAGPDIPIGVDANQGWDLETAKRMLADLEPLGILFAEQPIPGDDLSELAELRRSTSIPIMADESIFTANDARQLTRSNSVDILSVYPGKHGGISSTVEIVNIAKAAGIVCAMGSNLELGIGTAAQLHLGAALSTIACEQFPGDFLGPLYHEADLLTNPLSLGPSEAQVPDAPGLGVEVDDEQLERYRDTNQVAQPLD